MDVSEKVAYLKGLAEGLDIQDSTKEGKMLLAILDVLSEMADSIDCLEFDMDLLSNEVDSLDEELGLLLDEDFEEEDDDCGCCHGHDADDYDDYEGEIYQVTCPKCGEVILLDEDDLDEGELFCIKCKEPLEIDFSDVSDEEL